MKIGRLNKKIEIQQKTTTTNEFGEPENSWETFTNVWARINPISAKEYFSAQGFEHTVTHKITIRFIEGVKPDMRIVYGNRIFEITAVRNINESNRWIELLAKEYANV
jgi:SPP1 family predicted phage head-tail adaptor